MFPKPADENDIQALQDLIEYPDLEAVAREADRFNIFEAVDVVRRELHHSAFLAYLFNPNENYGLGDAFACQFLKTAVAGAEPETLKVRPIDLALWDFDQLEIRREWQNIDSHTRVLHHQPAGSGAPQSDHWPRHNGDPAKAV
ncbi:MAG TPA: PD-(D/E)XK nuclease family protein [Chloroflexi bacterium]|nr:PD-(D/E)XK nuclease family protein [Chloroflexota bacterium]